MILRLFEANLQIDYRACLHHENNVSSITVPESNECPNCSKRGPRGSAIPSEVRENTQAHHKS